MLYPVPGWGRHANMEMSVVVPGVWFIVSISDWRGDEHGDR